MILGSTNISTLKLGSSAVQKVMLGATEVWSNFDPDFAAYLAAGVANGSTMNAANQTAVNAFIVGCKTDGIWSAIKASCLLCAWDSLAGALTPLVGAAPTNVNFVAGDYLRTTGLKGDGSSKYLESNRMIDDDPLNNNHQSAYLTEGDTTANLAAAIIGGAGGLGTSRLGKGGHWNRIGSTTGKTGSITNAGFHGTSRSSSSSYVTRTPSGSVTTTDTSFVITTPYEVDLFFWRNIGAESTNARCSFYSLGEALDLALLNARLTTLMAALT